MSDVAALEGACTGLWFCRSALWKGWGTGLTSWPPMWPDNFCRNGSALRCWAGTGPQKHGRQLIHASAQLCCVGFSTRFRPLPCCTAYAHCHSCHAAPTCLGGIVCLSAPVALITFALTCGPQASLLQLPSVMEVAALLDEPDPELLWMVSRTWGPNTDSFSHAGRLLKPDQSLVIEYAQQSCC